MKPKPKRVPRNAWAINPWEKRLAEECRLKLPGVTGWLRGRIDLERMEEIKREKEESI